MYPQLYDFKETKFSTTGEGEKVSIQNCGGKAE
jgi:hypothetical protein